VATLDFVHADGDRLVGRGDEMALLGKLVAGAAAGTGGTLLVEGEEGVGKTALLRAGLAAAAGCAVAWAAADEITRSVPFGLVAEWRDQLPGSGAAPAAGESVAELVSRQCAVTPVILVAENLQWADEASALVLGELGRAARRLPLLVVASRRLLARAGGGAHRAVRDWPVLPLNPLPPSGAAELLERMAGGRPGPRLGELARQAGGNPLYLRTLIGTLVEGGRIRVQEGQADIPSQIGRDGAFPLPADLTGLARARAAELGETGAQILRWAALLDPEFSIRDLVVITGRDVGELQDAVSAAVSMRILTVTGNRAAFCHGVIRRALYDGMPRSVRAALHLRAARSLADAGGEPARVAAQLAAVPDARQEWAVDWLTRTAPALLSEAPGLAATLLRRVLAGLADTDPRREGLQTAQAEAAFLLDQFEEAERVGSYVLARTRDADRAAAVSWFLAYALLRAGRAAAAAETAAAALRRPGLSESRGARLEAVRVLAQTELEPGDPAGSELGNRTPSEDAETQAAAALARAERAGDGLGAALALQALSHARLPRLDHTARLEMLDQALATAGAEASVDAEARATGLELQLLTRRAEALRLIGRPAEALETAERAMRKAERSGRLTWLARGELVAAYFTAGRWDDAIAQLDLDPDPDPATDLIVPAWHRLLVSGYRALIAVSRDDADGIRAFSGRPRDAPPRDLRGRMSAGAMLRARALAAERAGRASEAAGHLAEVLDQPWTGVLGLVCEVLPLLTRLALSAGAVPVADAAADAAAEAATAARPERMPAMTAIADHCRGLVAADPALVLSAASGYQSGRGPHDRALALEDAADLLAYHGEAAAARARLRDAIGVYHDLGAQWDIRRAEARLRARGIRRPHHRGRPAEAAARTGWETLTPTERKVAGLVASGQSNPEIAAKLLVSARTVQTHVSHILAKLGVRSRAEVAGKAPSVPLARPSSSHRSSSSERAQ
jgi:DNA-binding CsgD family transcriptional regulator/tetratricopeptide (TPR) repeat protein